MPERPLIAAYYFPNYHPDARNRAWHGEGWTEWDLVRAATPRYPGHRQPIVPAWGYFDESDPAWAAREIDLAADHGIDAFLFDWYHYEDGPFLQDALDRGFLGAPNRERLKFALMWANHTWIDIHPAKYVNPKHALAVGDVSEAAFERFSQEVIERYFSQPNYLWLDGAPYFSIYEIGTFIRGVGGMEAAERALTSFRERARAAGLPGIHLNVVMFGLRVLPSEVEIRDPVALVERLGFDSVGSYTWVHHAAPHAAGFPQGSYLAAAESNYQVWDESLTRYPVPYHPNVTMGWDSSPRTIATDRYENLGYPFMAVLEGNTPEAFRAALEHAREVLARPEARHKVLTLNAWNEWTEGSYLLPDTVTGTAYLEAVREVFGLPVPA